MAIECKDSMGERELKDSWQVSSWQAALRSTTEEEWMRQLILRVRHRCAMVHMSYRSQLKAAIGLSRIRSSRAGAAPRSRISGRRQN